MTANDHRAIFDERGFIGPFKLWEPEIMTEWWKRQRRVLLDPRAKERAIYDNPVNYDRHLDIPELGRLITEPAIVERMQHLIGPDILCWRTEFFPKNPGDPGTGWHQVETYSIGESSRPMLRETDERSPGMPMELTAWVAFTEATRENGCLTLLPGTHRNWYYDERGTMEWDDTRADNTFFGYDYSQLKLDPSWQPEDEEIAHLEMRPGEFIIFTARCVHGSHPNRSRRQRVGFSIRVVPTSVAVYEDMSEFDEFGHHFDLGGHGCVVISGRDDFGHNRIARATVHGDPFVPVAASPEAARLGAASR